MFFFKCNSQKVEEQVVTVFLIVYATVRTKQKLKDKTIVIEAKKDYSLNTILA
jgi:hypothetical protein